MTVSTGLMRRLGLSTPILQAPMAGGSDTPALIAAVSDAGGLGAAGVAYLTPALIAETVKAIRQKTSRPFALNLFAPLPAPKAPADYGPAIKQLAAYYDELGLPHPEPPVPANYGFDEQMAQVLESGASVFSFAFAPVPKAAIDAAKAKGMVVFGTATTVEEAVHLEGLGVDAVVAQGGEAGGHRGSFARPFEESMIGTMALVPQTVDAVTVPVIASGGIMDGRGIAAALALGASAVQMGTAFLTCEEAGAPEVYKQAILDAGENDTRITRAFSGRPARGIANRMLTELADAEIPDFPLQNALTRPLRSAAGKAGRPEYLSLWAGQGLRMARRRKAGDLVAELMKETEAAIGRLASTR